MRFFKKLDLGAKALGLFNASREILRTVDADDVVAIIAKIVELERLIRGTGNGAEKWGTLVSWFGSVFPQHADRIETLRTFAAAAVALFNAVGVFKR
jgi:hypothetical protein